MGEQKIQAQAIPLKDRLTPAVLHHVGGLVGQGLPHPLRITLEVVRAEDHSIAGEDKRTHQLLGAIPRHQGLGSRPAQQSLKQRNGPEALRPRRRRHESKPQQSSRSGQPTTCAKDPQTPPLSHLVSVDPGQVVARLFEPNLCRFQPRPGR